MGLAAGGLQSGGGMAAGLLPGATGTTLTLTGASTALQFVSTQASGSDAFKVTTSGARWHIGDGTTDYFTSDGSTRITAAGILASGLEVEVPTSRAVYLNGSTRSTGFIYDGSSLKVLGVAPFTPNTDQSINLGSATRQWSYVYFGGSLVADSSDSSGTPGAATINKPSGRSAIAAGAASAVITNSLVTAASHVFISPAVRDATGLLPIVVPAAGSFTVSTSANCTAALTFDWFVVH